MKYLTESLDHWHGEAARLKAENESLRVERDGLSARVDSLESAIRFTLDNPPEYHDQGMGCGLEDRNITDRYEAMAYGWGKAIDRYAECLPPDDLLDETPAQSLAHIKAQGAREALQRAMQTPGFSDTVVRVDLMREIIEKMEGES